VPIGTACLTLGRKEGGFSFEPEELIDAGDNVVAFIHVSGTGKTSRAPVEERVATVWTFREGRPVASEYFGEDRAAALEAVGLSEHDALADPP
jgi:ketosteroid isomerase-like protein